jgi:hypothetical protein
MVALIVSKVNTVVVPITIQNVSSVFQVITPMHQVKAPVYLAYRVNSMTPLVPLNANFALKILLPLTKIDKFPATNVLLAVRPKRAAPNVPIAHRVNLKTLSTTKQFAPTAPLALHKVTRIKTVVRNVSKEKKHQREEVVFVHLAIWVHSI